MNLNCRINCARSIGGGSHSRGPLPSPASDSDQSSLINRIYSLEEELRATKQALMEADKELQRHHEESLVARCTFQCPHKPSRDSFLRSIELLNAMVYREHRGSAGALAGGALTVTVVEGNIARAVPLQEVDVLVYPSCVCFVDRNGQNVHRSYRSFLVADDSVAAERKSSSDSVLRATCSIAKPPNHDDGLLMLIFFGVQSRNIVLDEVLHGYVPGVLQTVYPHGISMKGHYVDNADAEEDFLKPLGLTHAVDRGRTLRGGRLRQLQALKPHVLPQNSLGIPPKNHASEAASQTYSF
jgi:hypothetical protein